MLENYFKNYKNSENQDTVLKLIESENTFPTPLFDSVKIEIV